MDNYEAHRQKETLSTFKTRLLSVQTWLAEVCFFYQTDNYILPKCQQIKDILDGALAGFLDLTCFAEKEDFIKKTISQFSIDSLKSDQLLFKLKEIWIKFQSIDNFPFASLTNLKNTNEYLPKIKKAEKRLEALQQDIDYLDEPFVVADLFSRKRHSVKCPKSVRDYLDPKVAVLNLYVCLRNLDKYQLSMRENSQPPIIDKQHKIKNHGHDMMTRPGMYSIMSNDLNICNFHHDFGNSNERGTLNNKNTHNPFMPSLEEKARISELERENNRLQQMLDEETKISELESEKIRLQQQLEEADNNNQNLSDLFESVSEECEKTDKENKELKEENQKLKEENKELRIMIQKLQEEKEHHFKNMGNVNT